jgi:hypothetical protein
MTQNYVSHWIFFFLIALSPHASTTLQGAEELPLLPIHNIEAEHIEFNEKTILLVGNVKVTHEFGVIRCQEATLLLRQEKRAGETLPVERILLKEAVTIDFSEGHSLSSDEGDIDCATLECIFLATPPHVVTYISSSETGPLKTPLKATSKALKGKITKTPQGYELMSLRGEGAVHIESLKKDTIAKEACS